MRITPKRIFVSSIFFSLYYITVYYIWIKMNAKQLEKYYKDNFYTDHKNFCAPLYCIFIKELI